VSDTFLGESVTASTGQKRPAAPTASGSAAAKSQAIAAASPAGVPRVALAQIAPFLGDRARNLELHLEQIAAAREQGADFILFPELSLTGYFLRDMVPDVAVKLDAPEIAQLVAAAGDAALVIGLVEESERHLYYNAALLSEAGKILHVHRKVYLPTYGMFEEQRYFAAGHRITACQSRRFGRVGLLVCEDFWHLSAVAILQAEQIDVLVCIANSPARGVDADKVRTAEVYEQMAKTYARLLGAVVIFVNRVGFEDGLCFWGGSMVVGPDGATLAEAPQLDPALVVVPVDLEELRRARLITPLARDEQLLLTLEELSRIKRRRYES
jgi:predicted amidohydrolase